MKEYFIQSLFNDNSLSFEIDSAAISRDSSQQHDLTSLTHQDMKSLRLELNSLNIVEFSLHKLT